MDEEPNEHRGRRGAPGYAALAVLVVVGGGGAVAGVLSMVGEDRAGNALASSVACPDGELVETPALDEVRVPVFESAREAAEGWAGPGAGDLRLSHDDRFAYLDRGDGSVRARMHLDSTRVDLDAGEPTSWWVNGSEVCSDEVSTQQWDGTGDASCLGGTVAGRVIYPPSGDQRALTAGEGLEFVDPRHDEAEVKLTSGAKSGDLTVTVSGPGGPHTWVRLLRVDDTWRVHELVACSRQLPGLPTSRTAELVRLHVGHCWIEPLPYDGVEWAVEAERQFGWGGGTPDRWVGYGTVTPQEGALRYVDAGGAELDLFPTGDPRTELPGGGICA